MLIECEVYEHTGGHVQHAGCTWAEQVIVRKVIDTDLYNFYDYDLVKDTNICPYKNQVRIPYKTVTIPKKYPLVMDRKTLDKILQLLHNKIIKI